MNDFYPEQACDMFGTALPGDAPACQYRRHAAKSHHTTDTHKTMIASITGATGFIGSHVADRLLERGYRVRALVRKTSNLRWLKDKPVELIEGDIRDAGSLESFIRGADYVYNIAAVVKARSWDEYYEGNVLSTRNMLKASQQFAPNIKKFLHVSSQTATGPSYSLTEPVNEETPCRPITRYGRSKLEAENEVNAFAERLPVTIARAPAVYGPRDTEVFIYFRTVYKHLNSMIGFNDKRVSLLHSDDLVRGMILAAESEFAAGKTYFISSEEYYSWPQVGKLTAAIMKKWYVTVRVPHFIVYFIAAIAQTIAAMQRKAATLNIEKARDITQQYWVCDTSKAVHELGYRQELSIEEGIRNTVAWYEQQGWL